MMIRTVITSVVFLLALSREGVAEADAGVRLAPSFSMSMLRSCYTTELRLVRNMEVFRESLTSSRPQSRPLQRQFPAKLDC
jgi:hypothetical protein